MLDGVAAVVNGDVITFSQVRELVGARERTLRAQYSGQELVNKIKEARVGALKDLIDRSLVLQEFKKKEFNLPPRVIDDRINSIIREDFGGDRQAFLKTLVAQGYTMTRFREIERDKFIVQAMRYSNIKGDLLVSPQRVQEFANSGTIRTEMTAQEQVHLRLIAIKKSERVRSGDEDPQRAMANEIRAKIVKGASFAQMASMYSDDSSRPNGGDYGWVDRRTLKPELTKVIFSLKTKEVSPVMDLGDGYFILMIDERKSPAQKPIAEIRPEVERRLQSEDRQKMTDAWLEGLRQKAYIRMF